METGGANGLLKSQAKAFEQDKLVEDLTSEEEDEYDEEEEE